MNLNVHAKFFLIETFIISNNRIPSQTTGFGKKWLDALKKLTTKFSGTYVCSLHFNPCDIEVLDSTTKGLKYVKLKRGALPRKCVKPVPATET